MSNSGPEPPTTLLATNAKSVNSLAIVSYILLIYFLWVKQSSSCKICEGTLLPDWTKIVFAITTGASCGSCVVQTIRLIVRSYGGTHGVNGFSASVTLLVLMVLASTNHLLGLFEIFENTCVDEFGVKSHIGQWAEWQVSVPFMFYLGITLDCNKTFLSIADYAILVFSWGGIFGVFVTVWGLQSHWTAFSLLLAILSMGLALGLLYSSALESVRIATDDSIRQRGNLSPSQFIQLRVAKRKLVAATYLMIVLPIYPIFYFMGVFGIISKDFCSVIMVILNFVGKLMYSVAVMDAQTELLDPNSFHLMVEKRANESRRAFLRYVFHEVRVPLNSISMGLHVLLGSDGISSEDRETIDMMKEATHFMTETLNDVLSIQKIEEGKLDLQYQKTHVKTIIQTVQMSMKGNVTAKNINLVVLMDKTVPPCILADRFRLEHVLANLVSNAVKFSHRDSKIEIRVRNLNPTRPHEITFGVKDEGVGISEEDQKSLFTPYMQVNPNDLQQGKGTGVGLAICREIVLLHGGEIGIHSKVRVPGIESEEFGSEFYFTIPFEVLPEDEPVAPTEAEAAASSATTEASRVSEDGTVTKKPPVLDKPMIAANYAALADLKVLIVDDVNSNRKMLNMLLTKKGLTADMVCDGSECIEAIEKNGDYDIVFMDSMMPIMNGVDTTMKLRKSMNYRKIIVGLTGNALDEDVQEFLNAGVDVVLAKPLKMLELDSLLAHTLTHGTATTAFDIAEGRSDSPSFISIREINNRT